MKSKARSRVNNEIPYTKDSKTGEMVILDYRIYERLSLSFS